MAKVEIQIPKDLGLTKEQVDVLKESFKRQLVEAIEANRAKQLKVDARAASISNQVKFRPTERA